MRHPDLVAPGRDAARSRSPVRLHVQARGPTRSPRRRSAPTGARPRVPLVIRAFGNTADHLALIDRGSRAGGKAGLIA